MSLWPARKTASGVVATLDPADDQRYA